jgi:peptide deformylase
MIYPIHVYGNPVLRKVSQAVDLNDHSLPELIEDMFETMYSARGVGLAAPQIGKALRIFVLDSQPYQEIFPEEEPRKLVFINPQIEELFGESIALNEGCLSLPEIYEEVVRKSSVKINFWDEKGEYHKEVFHGIVARIIQHEYDHIDGKVFTDRVSTLKKMLLKRNLSDISDGKIKTNYKIKR